MSLFGIEVSGSPALMLVSSQITQGIPPMPNCAAKEVPFSKLGRRKVNVRFDGDAIRSDGGLLLLREVERRLGLLKTVAETLPDPRGPLLVKPRFFI